MRNKLFLQIFLIETLNLGLQSYAQLSGKWWTVFYFWGFYVIAVLFLLNLVSSLTIFMLWSPEITGNVQRYTQLLGHMTFSHLCKMSTSMFGALQHNRASLQGAHGLDPDKLVCWTSIPGVSLLQIAAFVLEAFFAEMEMSASAKQLDDNPDHEVRFLSEDEKFLVTFSRTRQTIFSTVRSCRLISSPGASWRNTRFFCKAHYPLTSYGICYCYWWTWRIIIKDLMHILCRISHPVSVLKVI